MPDRSAIKELVELDRVYALQLVSEDCRGSKHAFYSYELNLVLNSGERINVVDHGDRNGLQEDAGSLSAFSGKPVWDAL